MKKLILILSVFFCSISYSQMVKTSVSYAQPTGEAPATNMISNGTFDDASDWTPVIYWSIAAGVASYNNGGEGFIYQADADMVSSITSSTDYNIQFDITGLPGTNTHFYVQNSDGSNSYIGQTSITNGHYSIDFTTLSDIGVAGLRFRCYNAGAFNIDNVELILD